jgi:hypothetical protein
MISSKSAFLCVIPLWWLLKFVYSCSNMVPLFLLLCGCLQYRVKFTIDDAAARPSVFNCIASTFDWQNVVIVYQLFTCCNFDSFFQRCGSDCSCKFKTIYLWRRRVSAKQASAMLLSWICCMQPCFCMTGSSFFLFVLFTSSSVQTNMLGSSYTDACICSIRRSGQSSGHIRFRNKGDLVVACNCWLLRFQFRCQIFLYAYISVIDEHALIMFNDFIIHSVYCCSVVLLTRQSISCILLILYIFR